ncbi:hypothetical protein [Cystobacter fuscus]|uniref:hypothetical protein n=1 Tax=Cystobacter fuscus TaxID=43 RepID=UPI002B30927D|nr:hypothetical protein F0U63_12315 [Cystobacter fuscus]
MAETMGDALGLQILRAVQELGTRMERVEVQVNHLSTRVDALTERVDRLEVRMDRLEERMDRLEAQVNHLSTRVERVEAQVNHLNTRVDGLSARMDKQEKWMERLAAEFLHFREEVRGDIRQWRVELQEDHRRLKKRLDATATTVVLMASVLRGPTEFSVELEANLSELHAS